MEDLYKELGALTKCKECWEENIPYVASLLQHDSTKIKAKALWLLGEMGQAFPKAVSEHVAAVSAFLGSSEPLLRERVLNALGRIGRGCYQNVEPYWAELFRFAHDEVANVRLAFIWASENIATNTPDPYMDYMPLFAELLHDSDDRVRMEAPEMFRVIGKRRPEFVKPYLEKLRDIADSDPNRVVRIHCMGAVRAAENTCLANCSLNSKQFLSIYPKKDAKMKLFLNISKYLCKKKCSPPPQSPRNKIRRAAFVSVINF